MTHGHPKLRGFTEHSVTANGFEIRYWERGDSDQLPSLRFTALADPMVTPPGRHSRYWLNVDA